MVYSLLERPVRTDGGIYSLGSVLHFCTYRVNYTIRSQRGNTLAFCEKFQHIQIIGVVLNWRTELRRHAGRHVLRRQCKLTHSMSETTIPLDSTVRTLRL